MYEQISKCKHKLKKEKWNKTLKRALRFLPSKRFKAIWAQVMYLSVGAGPFLEMIRGVRAWGREMVEKRREEKSEEEKRRVKKRREEWRREEKRRVKKRREERRREEKSEEEKRRRMMKISEMEEKRVENVMKGK